MAALANNLASALSAAAASALSLGANQVSPVPVVAIPTTPYLWIGPPKIVLIEAGSWDHRVYQFPMTYIITRVREDADQTLINEALESVLTVFRSGITLALVNPQPIALISAADTDKFYTLSGTDYQGIEFTWTIDIWGPQSYTA